MEDCSECACVWIDSDGARCDMAVRELDIAANGSIDIPVWCPLLLGLREKGVEIDWREGCDVHLG